jgi:hypothetical protein
MESLRAGSAPGLGEEAALMSACVQLEELRAELETPRSNGRVRVSRELWGG